MVKKWISLAVLRENNSVNLIGQSGVETSLIYGEQNQYRHPGIVISCQSVITISVLNAKSYTQIDLLPIDSPYINNNSCQIGQCLLVIKLINKTKYNLLHIIYMLVFRWCYFFDWVRCKVVIWIKCIMIANKCYM